MQKCLSASVNRSAHQNFLTTPRLPQVQPLEQMSKEWEVDCQVPLELMLAFYYMLFTSVSQVDFCERECSVARTSFGHVFLSGIHNR